MNIAESFAKFLQDDLGIATLGQDLFIGEIPSSNKVAGKVWWLETTGGAIDVKLVTGEYVNSYTIQLYCRSRNYKSVYEALQALEESVNCDRCVQLDGYETRDVRASILGVDDDLDLEDRKVGLLGIEVGVYQAC